MRDILFRGKRTDKWGHGKWAEGYLDVFEGTSFILFNHNDPYTYHRVEVDPDTVGQFTGLLDVDGVKIFEGDIIQNVTPNSERKFAGPVQWSGLFNSWVVNSIHSLYGQIETYKVIGNMHDTMEV